MVTRRSSSEPDQARSIPLSETDDVQLGRPKPVSVDAAMALLAAVLAGSGISQVLGFAWGLSTRVALAFIAVGLPMLFIQRRLGYHLDGARFRVDVLTGTRELDLREVTDARVVDGWLLFGLARVSLPAYHTGLFYLPGQGQVRAYASRVRGPYVLLERGGDRPWLLSPHDPEGFVETLRERAPVAAGSTGDGRNLS